MNRILNDLDYIEGVLNFVSRLGDDVFSTELANKTGFSRRVVDEAKYKIKEIREEFCQNEEGRECT